MENLVTMENLFEGVYKSKKVLVTGYTGFKGSWLSLWLQMMGAKVYGYSLPAPTNPNHIGLLNLQMETMEADIRDAEKLAVYIRSVKPEVVFHLAAQPLVRTSYGNPVETYSTNVMGTLYLYEACRKVDSVKAIVNVTSDKCYENREWVWGYRENDPMGGFDPYSSSKGCSELLTASYRSSYFNLHDYKKSHQVLLASGRAGNVIGGGDWATDRLFADIAKAAAAQQQVIIRNRKATRPWQHVLEPLSGYLTLGAHLLQGQSNFAEGWNFGPAASSNLQVEEVVAIAQKQWNAIEPVYPVLEGQHEANLLMLDCAKAYKLMQWKPVWSIQTTVEKTIGWYKSYYDKGEILSVGQINDYVRDAQNLELAWAG